VRSILLTRETRWTADPYSELRSLSGPRCFGIHRPLTSTDVDAVDAALVI